MQPPRSAPDEPPPSRPDRATADDPPRRRPDRPIAGEPPTLSDGVIVLRARRPQDVDAITAACQDPEIPRWTLVPSPYTRAHAVENLAQAAIEWRAGTAAHFLAVDRAGELLGSFSLMEIDRRRGSAEIGYWVAAPARRQGVATRAVRLLRDWAHEALGLRTVEILTDEANAASRAVAERAGFRWTGRRTANPRDPDGRQDYLVYASATR